MMRNKKFKSDWLASSPIFYNEKNKKISHNINDVIDYKNIEFHPEGLANFLSWGYSVFGQTPLKNIKFLNPNQEITVTKKNKFKIISSSDPVQKWSNKIRRVDDVISLIQKKVSDWEKNTNGPIIIPTSGGYDSRLLNSFISNRSRIKAYTYGTSSNQTDSFEIKYAKDFTSVLGIDWQPITLSNYHHFAEDWLKEYGVSTHLHGMYQLEFYKKIKERNKSGNVLSGIIGDVWSGKADIPEIKSSDDLAYLGYTHGLNADPKAMKIPHDNYLKNEYFEKNKDNFKNKSYRIVESMRHKIMLLSYLIEIPKRMGFEVYGPFLDIDVVEAIMNLKSSDKKNRLWQEKYFRKNGIMSEDRIKKANHNNNLDQKTINQYPLKPLDSKLLSSIFDKRYIEWINDKIRSCPSNHFKKKLFETRYIGYIMNKINIPNSQMNAYAAYQTIRPLEWIMQKKEGLK